MYSPREILIALAIYYKGEWDDIYHAISNKELLPKEIMNEILKNVHCSCLTILDEEYPNTLRNVYRPPFVLFYYGDISLIKDYNKCLSIVGSRNATIYGENATRKIIKELKAEIIIVSGLAKGIDSIAHEEAIIQGHKTIAVLGTGIDYCYPKENQKLYNQIKQNHLILSEYYGDIAGKPENFPIRNRIIVGLSKGVLVPEVKEKSGTSTSINIAISNNRDVMVIPYPIDSGNINNLLIQAGAYLVQNGEDVNNIIK